MGPLSRGYGTCITHRYIAYAYCSKLVVLSSNVIIITNHHYMQSYSMFYSTWILMIELLNFTGSYLGAKEKFNLEILHSIAYILFFRGGRSNTHQEYKQIAICSHNLICHPQQPAKVKHNATLEPT